MADMVRAHVHVTGMVQGVTFRASTRETARRRGVDGWVRNLSDGRVEAVFEGAPAAVDSMIEWCRDGPPAARVDDVAVEFEEASGRAGFEVRR